MNLEKILQDINKYSNMNKLTFFIGAGVSKLSGFPSWFDLVCSMGEELRYDFKMIYDEDGVGEINLKSDEYLKIPEMYYVTFGEKHYIAKVKKIFKGNRKPNQIHDLIMSLHPNHILTTNYDSLIEECATKFGENYSIIASDKDVANAQTARYLIKVHGDFSDKFVLKESDYLDYEFNYPLISNLMKSIFATNLVIFIGYSLGDYNIKLILNWIQKIQNDNFIKPIIVNVDKKSSDLELKYYAERGIRVLECNKSLEGLEYVQRYEKTLGKIINQSSGYGVSNKRKVVNFLYEKVKGISNLSYIRRSDFNKMFSGEFEINDEWKINQLESSTKKNNLWNRYFENRNEYIKTSKKKCRIIDAFIKSCNIVDVDSNILTFTPNIKLESISFLNKFEEMNSFCSTNYRDSKESFKKAYYLNKMGKLLESYNLFTDILDNLKKNNDWDIYYLAQVNRYHIYKMIKLTKEYSEHFSTIYIHGDKKIFDPKIYQSMCSEMSWWNIQTQFDELPSIFKNNYSFLEKFSYRNCLSDEINYLMKKKYEFERAFGNSELEIGKLSIFDDIKVKMLETIKFIEDNMICVLEYVEIKNYIKNSLFTWLRAYEFEIKRKTAAEVKGNIYISNTQLKFELQDILLLSKSCKVEDLNYFKKNIHFSDILFEETEELKKYVNELISYYIKKFSDGVVDPEYSYFKALESEIKILLWISSYYLKDDSVVVEITEQLIDYPIFLTNDTDKMQIIEKFVTDNNVFCILKILEKYLIDKIKTYIDNKVNNNNNDALICIKKISDTIADISSCKNYNFSELSDCINRIEKEDLNLIKSEIVNIEPYLSLDEKKVFF